MDGDRRSPFGTLLRELRLGAGLSQEALAEQARLAAETISGLERGKRKVPYRETVALLAQALKCRRPTGSGLRPPAGRGHSRDVAASCGATTYRSP